MKDRELVARYNPWELDLPLPSVSRLYEENLTALRRLYGELGAYLREAMSTLAAWDDLNDTERDRVREATVHLAPARAVERYEELLGQLAAEYPEVRFWCAAQDSRSVRSALARLEEALSETTTELTPDVRLAELAAVYRGALRRPLVKVAVGVQIPSLADAYVDPLFQVVIGTEQRGAPSLLAWWDDVPVRDDLYAYLVGYLTSPAALSAPLLVLGDPGSGKSVLTEMLAARLPASDFAVVRVELRGTPVDADLRRQIEHGLRKLLHEPVSWADFSRNTGGALPVVILDGFDELLQATGVSQARYLTVIAEFQQALMDMGRPAVFVVTSRLSVCAGLQLPEDAQVVRLLPFSDGQVRAWLDVWNKVNRPLPVETVLQYPDLASQPLLLLMLALYDAVDNSFQSDHLSMSRGQLYERLLHRFARREVTKDDVDRSAADLAADVESELERLSVVALAMFNRGSQWVAEHQVTSDLAQLLGAGSPDRLEGTRTRLSAGETVLGRFFFVQKSEAVREDQTVLRTYEFLHATFGEYLVARFVWERLLVLQREDAARSRRKSTVDDTELYSVLSFMALTSSKPVLDFLREFARESAKKSGEDGLFDLVVRLFGARGERRLSRGEYEPVALTDSVRDAKYSVNLVALAVVLKDKVSGQALQVAVDEWHREALFWKSRLPEAEWTSVVRCFWVETDPHCEFVVSLSKRTQDVRAEWLLLSEPDVTQDLLAMRLRDAVMPLASQHSLEVSAALIELMATPLERIAPAIRRLVQADAPGRVVLREADARLGLGGDDVAIVKATYGVPGPADREVQLDAWLRLHERGFRFELVPEVRDLSSLLSSVELWEVFQRRPDLFKRATAAAAESGLEWPPSAWPRPHPDPPR